MMLQLLLLVGDKLFKSFPGQELLFERETLSLLKEGGRSWREDMKNSLFTGICHALD